MTVQLPQEQFKLKQVLAALTTQITRARAELSQLEASKESFLEEREEELSQRIDELLSASKEALAEVTRNHEELEHQHNQLRHYAEEVQKYHERVKGQEEQIKEKEQKKLASIDSKYKELQELIIALKHERSLIDIDTDIVKAGEIRNKSFKTHIESQQETLSQAYNYMKKYGKPQRNIKT